MAPSGAKVGRLFLLILCYIAHRGVVADTLMPGFGGSADFTAEMDSSSSAMMIVPFTPTPSLPTNGTQTGGLTTDQIVGLAVGLSATVILVSILTVIVIFFSIRSYMHKSSAVTPLKSPKEDDGKVNVIQVTSVKHGEPVAMDSLPKSA